MPVPVSIPARFNGPPQSGNGGYSCGVLAAHIPGPASVRLHCPPPLDTPMEIRAAAGGAVEMWAGDTLVGSGAPVSLQLDIPEAPSPEAAAQASRGFAGYHNHDYPTCFVCGPRRPDSDGLCLFPGPLADSTVQACTWQPAADLLDRDGMVRSEIVWSALDCPGYFAAMGDELRTCLLGQLECDIREPVPGNQTLVVYAWPLGEDGRKIYAGAAIADSSGRTLACSRSTWILLRRPD